MSLNILKQTVLKAKQNAECETLQVSADSNGERI